jgi:hypothetical protein
VCPEESVDVTILHFFFPPGAAPPIETRGFEDDVVEDAGASTISIAGPATSTAEAEADADGGADAAERTVDEDAVADAVAVAVAVVAVVVVVGPWRIPINAKRTPATLNDKKAQTVSTSHRGVPQISAAGFFADPSSGGVDVADPEGVPFDPGVSSSFVFSDGDESGAPIPTAVSPELPSTR